MKEILILLRVATLRVLGINKLKYTTDKKAKARGRAGLVGLALIAIMLLATSAFYSYAMAISFEMIGMLRLLPTIMMSMTCVIGIVTTMLRANAALFGYRDYDLMMSLPVSANKVMLSRLISLYCTELLFSAFVMLPVGIVYAIFAKPIAFYYVAFIVTFFLIPLIPLTLSAFIGLLVARVGASFKHKNLVTTILGLAALCLIMAFSFDIKGMQNLVVNFSDIGVSIANAIHRLYPVSVWYEAALCDGDALSLALFAIVSLGAFLLLAFLLGKYNKSLYGWLTKASTRSNYKVGRLKASRPVVALYKKELRRYGASPIYIMNTAAGSILMTLACIALLASGGDLSAIENEMEMQGLSEMLSVAAPYFLALFVSMSNTTASSISIEGKSFWLLKSLPIQFADIIYAKSLLSLTITVPAILVNATILSLVLHSSPIQTAANILIPLAVALFMPLIGLIANLMWPKFDWSNEAQIVKQGAPVAVSMFGGMIISAAPIAFRGAFGAGFDLVYALIALALSFALLVWLKTKGAKRFAAMQP